MGPTHTFRTLYARVLTVLAGALIVVVLIYSLIDGGIDALWQALPFLVIGGGLVWVLFGNPKVEVADGGITVVNIVRRVHVPWPTLRGVESRWALSVETTEGTYSSWAIPASSGMGTRLRRPRTKMATGEAETGRSLETGHNAAAVALVIGQRLDSLTAAGYLEDRPTHEPVRPTPGWNTRELGVLGVVVLTVAIMVLTG
ncbi:PH domain-containing protein [Pseudactinotalea sp. Z1732]|uniref:PH domain-containing protein n=1 Tax=Micrococcales TaxID=85006 RepID=UPI003C7E5FCE